MTKRFVSAGDIKESAKRLREREKVPDGLGLREIYLDITGK